MDHPLIHFDLAENNHEKEKGAAHSFLAFRRRARIITKQSEGDSRHKTGSHDHDRGPALERANASRCEPSHKSICSTLTLQAATGKVVRKER